MGFGIGSIGKKLFGKGKNLFKFGTDAGLNLITMGGYSQAKATDEAKKARDQAQKQYQAEIAAAQATAQKITEDEEERKRRLMLSGNQLPSTLFNTYLGASGPANLRRGTLG